MTGPRVLVLNTGSGTFKWSVLDGRGRSVLDAGTETWAAADLSRRTEQIRLALRRVGACEAVGHRVVHGGARFVAPTRIEEAERRELGALVELAPLHMEPALAAIDAARAEWPAAPQVAAFDTAFHASIGEAARGYGLPQEWTERWDLRRFGFHGLSIEHAVERVRQLLGAIPARTLVCHLGAGCSITALRDGRSIDTTMGYTPLDGVMMATRSGSVDPGLLLHLQRRHGVGVAELEDVLTHRSGLLGVSGVSGDLRAVIAAAEQGSARARLAYDRFVWSLRRGVGSMAGVLGGADAIVFTGGIGENCAAVRAELAGTLDGLHLADQGGEGDRILSGQGSRIAALLVHAREDLVVLDAVMRTLDRCA